jgi:hypothetical protein
MKVTMLAKSRIMIEHNGKKLRIEASDKDTGFRLYFPPESRLKMPRNLVVGYRKMVID